MLSTLGPDCSGCSWRETQDSPESRSHYRTLQITAHCFIMAVVDMFRRTYISKTLTRIMILRHCWRPHKFRRDDSCPALCFRFLSDRSFRFVFFLPAGREGGFKVAVSQVSDRICCCRIPAGLPQEFKFILQLLYVVLLVTERVWDFSRLLTAVMG